MTEVLAGYLVSGMSQPHVNVAKVAQQIQDAGFDGIHFFMTPIWARETPVQWNFTWWTAKGAYEEQYRAYREEFGNRKMLLYTTIFDQYGDRDPRFPGPLGDIPVKHLYATTPVFNQSWLAWTANDADKTSVFKLRPPFGPQLGAFLDWKAKVDFEYQEKFKDKPRKGRMVVNLFNEENASNKPDGKFVRGRGGEDKIKHWFREQILNKNGIQLNKKYRMAVNFENYADPKVGGGPKNYHWAVTEKNVKTIMGAPKLNAKGVLSNLGSLWEVHNIGSPQEVDLILDHNINVDKVVLSTDATPDSPKGIAATIAHVRANCPKSIMVVKAGNAGAKFESVLGDTNVFVDKTIRELEKLL